MPLVLPRFEAWESQEGYAELFALPCFFALLPPSQMASEISKIARTWASAFHLDWDKHGQPNLHISVCALARMVRVLEPPIAIRKAVNAFDFEAFDARFDKVKSFDLRNGQHALVLEADEDTTFRVRSFASALATTMLYRAGVKVSPVSNIQPHITLLYDPRRRDVSESIAPIQWRVDKFALIRSHVGGKTHENLGNWPLRQI